MKPSMGLGGVISASVISESVFDARPDGSLITDLLITDLLTFGTAGRCGAMNDQCGS